VPLAGAVVVVMSQVLETRHLDAPCP
jgi:hypothetical protein